MCFQSWKSQLQVTENRPVIAGIRGEIMNTQGQRGGTLGGVKNCSVSWLYLWLHESIQVLKFIALYNKQINAIDYIKKKVQSLIFKVSDSGGPGWGLGIWIEHTHPSAHSCGSDKGSPYFGKYRFSRKCDGLMSEDQNTDPSQLIAVWCWVLL